MRIPSHIFCRKIGWSITALAIVTLILIVACQNREEPLRIGFLGELTGRGSVFGRAGRDGAILAIEEANRNGGVNGHQVKLIPDDYRDGADDIVDALRRLESQNVEAIVGPMTSAASVAIMQPSPLTDLVLFSPTSETSTLAGIEDQFFRASPASHISAKMLVRHMLEERDIRTISIVCDTDNGEFTRDYQEAFKQEYIREGGSIVATFPFNAHDSTSFSRLAAQVYASRSEGVLLLTHAADTAMYCQQAKKNDFQQAVFCTSWASSPQLTQMGGKSVEGLTWIQGSAYDDQSVSYQKFCDNYLARFGQRPDYAAMHAYEATGMLLKALAGDENRPLAERLLNLGRFSGPQGTLRISRSGDVIRNLYLLTIKDGKIISLARSQKPFRTPTDN